MTIHNDPLHGFPHAVARHQEGRLADAERLYEEVLRHQPDHFDALHLLGVIALQSGRPERGVALIRNALALDPRNWPAYGNLGMGLATLRRFEDALACYDQAIALNPDYREAHNNRSNALRELGRYEEALAGCDRAIALKPDYAEAHSNRSLILSDLRRYQEALVSADTAISLAPDLASAHNMRGNALRNLQRYAEAVASHDRAIARDPESADGHHGRGVALSDLRRHEEALASYDRALVLKPEFAQTYNNRGGALRGLRRYEEALASYDRAIALDPNLPETHNNRGLSLNELQRYDEALRSYDRAIALQPDFAEAWWNKGLCLLQLGRFEEGWPLYEWRSRRAEAAEVRCYPQPHWRGRESIVGKTLFVHCEQGFGDTLQFCRYAALARARGARVVLAVQAPLLRLLKQLEPEIEVIAEGEIPGAFDYHCPLMSLPLAMGTRLETIPSERRYLAADEGVKAEWAGRLPPKGKPRIGLAWRGRPTHKNDHNRSMTLASLLPLLCDDADWVCLQKDLDDEDALLLRENGRIAVVGDRLEDFADTAALIDLLDMVVTVDTSVAHLAGALGKPVWIVLPFNPDWRWMTERNDSPWYPSARLFRQRKIGDWSHVVGELRHALAGALGGSGMTPPPLSAEVPKKLYVNVGNGVWAEIPMAR